MVEDGEQGFVRFTDGNADFEDVLGRTRNFHRRFRIEKRRLPLPTGNVDVKVQNVGASFALATPERRLHLTSTLSNFFPPSTTATQKAS
jgi:hypothetical protein